MMNSHRIPLSKNTTLPTHFVQSKTTHVSNEIKCIATVCAYMVSDFKSYCECFYEF